MLFRKLRLDWKYGLSELAIVVAGVLIALWAENWRQGRRDRVLERDYVDRLIEDLRLDTAALANIIDLTEQRAQHAQTMLTSFDTGTRLSDPNAFVEAVEFGGYFSYPRYTTRTIDDLNSTGNLRLIRDAKVKDVIDQYYAEIEWTGQFRDLQLGTQETLGLVKADVLDLQQRYALFQEGTSQQCGARGLTCVGVIPWGPSGLAVTEAEADTVLARLLERPEARTLYAQMGRIQGQHYSNLTTIRQLASNALDVLQEYTASWD